MPFEAYAARDDVYTLALSAQAFAVRPRPVESIDPDTGTIRLTAHGFSAEDAILFDAPTGGELPIELSTFVYVTPIVVGSDLFRLDGISTFTTEGSGVRVVADPGRRLDAHLREAASRINQNLTAHSPPIEVDPITGRYPQVLIGLNARMGARSAVISLQIENAAYRVAVDRLFAQEAADDRMLDQLRTGWPILPRPVDQTDEPDDGARAAGARVAIPWQTGGL